MKKFFWLETIHHGSVCVNADHIVTLTISQFNRDHTQVHMSDGTTLDVEFSMTVVCKMLNGD